MSFSWRSALLGAALFSAQAAAVEFTFVSGNPAPEAFGNSHTQMLDGLTTTVTAWSTTGRRGSHQTAELEIHAGYGMGYATVAKASTVPVAATCMRSTTRAPTISSCSPF